MRLSVQDWHDRFTQQASWTRELRTYLYDKSNTAAAKRILDAGCGTGSLLAELNRHPDSTVFGIDLARQSLQKAKTLNPEAHLSGADMHHMPFPSGTFDVSLCHYVLLWVADPLQCLLELQRITRSGGYILALAEPDYNGRVDYPENLAVLGEWQRSSLKRQGAQPAIGRKLRSFFQQANLTEIECGVLSGMWSPGFDESDWSLEWKVIEFDIDYLDPRPDSVMVSNIKHQDFLAHQQNTRILFVPTFYAIGRVV